LTIREGAATHSMELDSTHLQSGSFTYGRQEERVDVTLTVSLPAGNAASEVATYLGKLPEHGPQTGGALERQNQKLANDLNAERARSKKLEDTLKLQEQRKRLAKQLRDQ
jgi:hypothetical protein